MTPPPSVAGCSRQLLAVTWNSGVGAMMTGGDGGVAGVAGAWPDAFTAARPEHAAQKPRCMMLVMHPRWVS